MYRRNNNFNLCPLCVIDPSYDRSIPGRITHPFVDKYGEVCPAGWQQGEDGMKASKDGYKDFLMKDKSDDKQIAGSADPASPHTKRLKRAMEDGL